MHAYIHTYITYIHHITIQYITLHYTTLHVYRNPRHRGIHNMHTGTLGKSFARDLKADDDMMQGYKGAVGHAAKAAFREEWCKKKLAEAQRRLEMQKEQRHELSDQIVGKFMPFRKVWEAEGLDEDGYVAIRGQEKDTPAKACMWRAI